jgi:hypothetical protein
VSTPRGAEVWLLAGIGPAARVEQLPCDKDVDVLVAGPTTLRKRLHAAGADFVPDPTQPGQGGTGQNAGQNAGQGAGQGVAGASRIARISAK